MKKIALLFVCMLAISFAFGQKQFLELVKSDIQAKKKILVAEAMDFSDEEAEIFWPIYNELQFELGKIDDQVFKLIKNFAKNYENMTDEKASELMSSNLDLEMKTLKVKKKYFKKMSKVLPAIQAARYFQVENQIDMLVNLKIASELPLLDVK